MSRCFPYPPPGYERKGGALDEALINSIKLQKERDKAKKEKKKEKRREKKEKGREREKAKENGGVEDQKQKHEKRRKNEKRHKNESGKVERGVGDRPKRTEEDAEPLEKSGLTEEHGQPISSQNLYDSTDSTQNSHKRKRHSSPSDIGHDNLGSIFRIRLKQKDQEILPNKELPCSNSGRTNHILQGKYEIPNRLGEEQQCSASARQQQFSTSGRTPVARQESLKQNDQQEILRTKKLPQSNLKEQQCSTSARQQQFSISGRTTVARQESLKQNGQQEILHTKKLPQSNLGKTCLNAQGKHEVCPKISEVEHFPASGRTTTIVPEGYGNDPRLSEEQTCSTSGGRMGVQPLETAECARKSSSKLKKIESLYRDLIENWVPLPIENNITDSDDQEWLFESVSKSEPEPKRNKPNGDGVCGERTSLWPQACYLPEADIYALPYTVPF